MVINFSFKRSNVKFSKQGYEIGDISWASNAILQFFDYQNRQIIIAALKSRRFISWNILSIKFIGDEISLGVNKLLLISLENKVNFSINKT